jgi:hypothetical protein
MDPLSLGNILQCCSFAVQGQPIVQVHGNYVNIICYRHLAWAIPDVRMSHTVTTPHTKFQILCLSHTNINRWHVRNTDTVHLQSNEKISINIFLTPVMFVHVCMCACVHMHTHTHTITDVYVSIILATLRTQTSWQPLTDRHIITYLL